MGLNRVTAGLPGLTAALRQFIDKARYHRERNTELVKDEIRRESATTAKDDSFDTTNPEQQLGRPLSGGELQKRLRACNPNLCFEVSLHDKTKTGIYVLESTGKRFVCGMETGISPEFSVRVAKDKRIPHPDNTGEWVTVRAIEKEIRGWRTVLAMLLRSRLISQPQIERVFAPHLGRQSRNWQALTT